MRRKEVELLNSKSAYFKKRTGTVKSFGYGISLSDVGKVFHPILTLDVVAEKGEITNNWDNGIALGGRAEVGGGEGEAALPQYLALISTDWHNAFLSYQIGTSW